MQTASACPDDLGTPAWEEEDVGCKGCGPSGPQVRPGLPLKQPSVLREPRGLGDPAERGANFIWVLPQPLGFPPAKQRAWRPGTPLPSLGCCLQKALLSSALPPHSPDPDALGNGGRGHSLKPPGGEDQHGQAGHGGWRRSLSLNFSKHLQGRHMALPAWRLGR